MDYRSTLNLPETKFSMKANLSFSELEILNFWAEIKLYDKNFYKKNIFILNDGPPYANGDIHIGHAFNKVLKDIVGRFKNQTGFFVNFTPGWDCHGLPIELNVERILQKKEHIISDNEFRSLCKNYAEEHISIQKKSFMRLGIRALWNDFYKTMDFSFEASIVRTFKDLFEKKYIYNSIRPVYWCFDCKSALADAELEYLDKNSDSIYIFFEIFDFKSHFNKFYFPKVGFIVWTTTPWTLPFNEAVALNSNSKYVLIAHKEIGYVVDQALLDVIVKKLNFNRIHILHTFDAIFFENLFTIHPFYNKLVKIVFSNHVTSDSGTGCVHIAPGYGYEDYKVALKYKLDIKNKIDMNGFLYGDVELFSNLHIKDVNSLIIKKLKDNGNLLLNEVLSHRYPHCWRHHTPLIFRTTNQWFLNVDNNFLRKKIINFSDYFIKWIPETGKIKIRSMLLDRPDWCISRQRIWGVPLFLFVNKYDETLHPRSIYILDEIVNIISEKGSDFWYTDDVFSRFNVDPNIYIKVNDVLDVWYDSGSVYKYILDKFDSLSLPFDLCIEGTDQYRGWFQSSLINSISVYNIPAFKTILAHGFVLDAFGRKMSKSVNNVISPNDVVKLYGADVLRLWVASVNYCFDVNISDEILNRICESYRKIRNTFRFLLANIYDFSPEYNLVNFVDLAFIDKWILCKFFYFKDDIINDFNEYKFYFVYKKIYNFCIEELGSKYFEIIKDSLYLARFNSKVRLSIQTVLYYILINFTKLISPILSFTSEDIWQNISKVDINSVHLSSFNIDVKLGMNDFNLFDYIVFNKLFSLKENINKFIEKLRKDSLIGTSLEIVADFFCNTYWFDLLFRFKNYLHLFFIISDNNLFFYNKVDYNGIFFNLYVTKKFKCERCWHRTVFFNKNNSLKICFRCISNIYYIN